jgi:peroxin-5
MFVNGELLVMDLSKALFNQAGCDPDGQMQSNPFTAAMQQFLLGPDSGHFIPAMADQQMHDHFDDAWEVSGVPQHMEQHPAVMEQLWQEEMHAHEEAERVWAEQEMQAAWQEEEEEGQLNVDFEGIWKEIEREMQAAADNFTPVVKTYEYKFAEFNPYLDDPNAYEIGIAKLGEGYVNEAILAIEATVQKNPEFSEAWRLLGNIHSENDDDTNAIAAFMRCHEIDPFNIDSLLSMGVSCSNEFDIQQALEHLKNYLLNHPDYSGIPVPRQLTKADLVHMFEHAHLMNPADADVASALGVLYFMSRNFEAAADIFKRGIEIRPQDHTLWNRLGACMSNLKNTQEAIVAYQRALELRPFYVRAWVNLGIAYSNLKDYSEAARFYLCGLALNPKAEHVWNYVNTAFLCMKRVDLCEKTELKDPYLFKDEFHVITRDELPKAAFP